MGGCAGAKSSRNISKLKYVGGYALSSPDKSRGKRNEVSERVPSAGGEIGLGQGGSRD